MDRPPADPVDRRRGRRQVTGTPNNRTCTCGSGLNLTAAVQSGFREGVRRTLGSVQAAAESMSHAALLAWLREQKTRADRGDDEPS